MTDFGFPVNMVDALAQSFATSATPSIQTVTQRRLRPTDPDGTLGIFAVNWKPKEFEIGGGMMLDATLQDYWIELHFVARVAGDAPYGTAQAAATAKIIRTMLYRDPDLGVALRACSETIDGVTERVLHWKVEEQKFFDAPSPAGGNNFVFLSTTRLWVETQTG